MKHFFITGGTGYIGTRLIRRMVDKGFPVTALVRSGSEHKVPAGAEIITGDPFDSQTFRSSIAGGSVFVQLLGVPHPSPRKARQFKEIDLRSVKASADAAVYAGASHFIYLSVSMAPGKLMHSFQEARKEGETYCLKKNLACTFIRPWYVLGPGHWWPILLLPLYGIAELIPSWRMKARAKALVTINQILSALLYACESEPVSLRVLEIKDIRKIEAKKMAEMKTLPPKPSYL